MISIDNNIMYDVNEQGKGNAVAADNNGEKKLQ